MSALDQVMLCVARVSERIRAAELAWLDWRLARVNARIARLDARIDAATGGGSQ